MSRGSVAFIVMFFIVLPVSARGVFDRDREEEPQTDSDVSSPEEPIEIPEWVGYILAEDYAPLYPGPDGGGYIGTGIGSTRQEAEAAAAVDFAGNVSTVVSSGIREERRESDEGVEDFSVVIESDVRSQAIISGLDPLIWEDPRSGVYYALFRATAEEYDRKLDEWIITMESLSEAEQRRERQRLEEERAAAERRLEEIRLEELQQQVREADRRLRAARYADFLSQSLPPVELGVPTGYAPAGIGITGTLRGERGDTAFDGSIDLGIARLIHINAGATGISEQSDGSVEGQIHGRFLLGLIRRVGWVTNTTVAIGAWGGNEVVDYNVDEGTGGVFVTADVLVPEWAHTRYSLYAGTDLINARAMWYPFWNTIESAVAFRTAAQIEFTNPGYTDGARDENYLGFGVVFAPVDGGWISIDTRNLSTISGTVTISF